MMVYPNGDHAPVNRMPATVRPRTQSPEITHLLDQIERLQQENVEMRSEITRLRLFQALDVPAEDDIDDDDALPHDARKLYYLLPARFSQISFFKMAHDVGFSIERSQTIIGLLLRNRFLRRAGSDQLQKVNPYQYHLSLK